MWLDPYCPHKSVRRLWLKWVGEAGSRDRKFGKVGTERSVLQWKSKVGNKSWKM